MAYVLTYPRERELYRNLAPHSLSEITKRAFSLALARKVVEDIMVDNGVPQRVHITRYQPRFTHIVGHHLNWERLRADWEGLHSKF